MAVKVRLRRMGRKNTPFYRVVASDSRCSNTGRFLESLGWYDPVKKDVNYSLNMERVDYWQQNGAIFSDTVKSLVRKARKNQHVAPAAPVAAEAVAPVAEAAPVAETAPVADAEAEAPAATETEEKPTDAS